MEPLTVLRELILRHHGGAPYSAVPRLRLLRADRPSGPMPALYQPRLCIIVQGRKRIVLGNRTFEYDAAHYLVATVDLPVTGDICEASPAVPYLGLTLDLDPAMLAAMLLEVPLPAEGMPGGAGMAVSALTAELLDPLVRLVRLLDRPGDIAMLAPLAEREILYRLLLGPQGGMLRQVARADSRLSQIARAIARIRRDFDRPLRVETLAAEAGMSTSTFHRHFKAVTAMSPLAFQKQIRLQEARRRLLARQAQASSIGFAVGYESPSQFSREYRRLFGVPPARDAARLRPPGTAADSGRAPDGAPHDRAATA